jgi:hypothetical protein
MLTNDAYDALEMGMTSITVISLLEERRRKGESKEMMLRDNGNADVL